MDHQPPFNNPYINHSANSDLPLEFNYGWNLQDSSQSEYMSHSQYPPHSQYPSHSQYHSQYPYHSSYTQFQVPSSQPSQYQPSQPSQSEPPAKQKSRNWSKEEDIALCKAWIMIGEDAVAGTDQSRSTMWEKIQSQFVSQMGGMTDRKGGALMNRFSSFQAKVNKFSGFYKNVSDNPSSGQNDQDIMETSKEVYRLQTKQEFKFEHCWNVLRNSVKWQIHCNAKQKPTQQTNKRGIYDLNINQLADCSESIPTTPGSSTPGASTPSSVNLDDDDLPANTEGSHDTRPAGRKAMKKRKNKNISLVSFQKNLLTELQDINEQGRMFGEAGAEGERLRLQLAMEKQRTKQLEIESRERMAKEEREDKIMLQDPANAPTEATRRWLIAKQNEIVKNLTEADGQI